MAFKWRMMEISSVFFRLGSGGGFLIGGEEIFSLVGRINNTPAGGFLQYT